MINGEPFGLYTIIEALPASLYRLQCACGSQPITRSLSAISAALRARAPRIYSCGCERLPPKPKRGRRPADYGGKTIGRLQVGDWEDGKGWLCLCLACQEAGAPEHMLYVRHSAGLAPRGFSECAELSVFQEYNRLMAIREGRANG